MSAISGSSVVALDSVALCFSGTAKLLRYGPLVTGPPAHHAKFNLWMPAWADPADALVA